MVHPSEDGAATCRSIADSQAAPNRRKATPSPSSRGRNEGDHMIPRTTPRQDKRNGKAWTWSLSRRGVPPSDLFIYDHLGNSAKAHTRCCVRPVWRCGRWPRWLGPGHPPEEGPGRTGPTAQANDAPASSLLVAMIGLSIARVQRCSNRPARPNLIAHGRRARPASGDPNAMHGDQFSKRTQRDRLIDLLKICTHASPTNFEARRNTT